MKRGEDRILLIYWGTRTAVCGKETFGIAVELDSKISGY